MTYKDVALKLLSKKVLDSLGGEDRVTVTWFWGNRGKDFSDHDQVIVLGYPFPREETVVDFASVLYQGEDLDTTTTTEWRPYLWDDGKLGLEVRVFQDPRLQRICEQLREAEFYQSIMRVRPLGHPWKRVILLTQVPALPEQDIVLSGLVETQELFDERPDNIRRRVDENARRLLRKLGWVGLPWMADLCPGEFPPVPLLDLSYRGSGGNLPPTVALLPKWPEVVKKLDTLDAGIPLNLGAGKKRIDRLRGYLDEVLPDGLSACQLSLRPVPPDPKGGRPWSAVVYTDGKKGRQDLLRRLTDLAESGQWAVLLEGEQQTGDDLRRLAKEAGRPDLSLNDSVAMGLADGLPGAEVIPEEEVPRNRSR